MRKFHSLAEVPEPDLRPGEVRVYVLDLQRLIDRHMELASVLSTDERERAGRFVGRRDRERFEVARGVLRRILARILAEQPEALRFGYGPYGKPHLVRRASADDQPAFNVSHSGDVAVVAVSRNADIGIDVERIRHMEDAFSIAERFFSPTEVALLAGLPPEDLDPAFLRCWTRKEAYVKAVGVGLQHPLTSFAVSCCSEEHAVFLADEDRCTEGWILAPLHVGPGYVGAICTTGESHSQRGKPVAHSVYVRVSA